MTSFDFDSTAKRTLALVTTEAATTQHKATQQTQAIADGRANPTGPGAEVCYFVKRECYLYKLDGVWQLGDPVRRAGIEKHLMSQCFAFSDEDIKACLDNSTHYIANLVDCMPGKPQFFVEDGKGYLNSYVPPTLVPAPGPYPRIARVIQNIVDGDPAAMEYVFNWCARLVQNPGAISGVALVFTGKKGTGKSSLGEFLAPILGEQNCVRNLDDRTVHDGRNAVFATKLLVCAEEVNVRDGLMPRLKAWITNSKVVVDTKFVPEYEATNRMSWIMASNELRPVPVEGSDDRRFSVFANFKEPTEEYKAMIASLYTLAHLNEGGMREVAAFAHALLNHKVDEVAATTVYDNAARRDLAEASRTSAEMFVDTLAEIGADGVHATHALALYDVKATDWDGLGGPTAEDLYKMYRVFCDANGVQACRSPTFFRALSAYKPAWDETRRVSASVNLKRPRVYVSVPRSGVLDSAGD